MQNDKNHEMLKKLKEFFNVIESEAKTNPDFLDKLANVFELKKDFDTKQIATAKVKEPIINIVEVLHNDGEESLRKELELLTNDKLLKLANQEGIKKFKNIKNIDRVDLVNALVVTAKNRLSQGKAFTN